MPIVAGLATTRRIYHSLGPEGPAAGDMRRLWPRAFCRMHRFAHRRGVGRIWDAWGNAWGDAWDPQATLPDRCETDRGIVYQMIATKTLAYAVADRGRPDLNSSFASFQSPSGDFAMPLI
jgi:hypothetical protein